MPQLYPGLAYEAGFEPKGPVAADLNGDGYKDLVVAQGYVGVLINNGDGTFQPEQVYSSQDNSLFHAAYIVVADVNNDSIPDLVVGKHTAGADGFTIFIGNGDGTFQAGITRQPNFSVEFVTAGDFNHDGNIDLATTSDAGMIGSVLIFFGNGDGTFQSHEHYDLSVHTRRLILCDLNGDGNSDIVYKGWEGWQFGVLLGNSDGSFQPEMVYPSSKFIATLNVFDANEDSVPDVVTIDVKTDPQTGHSTQYLGISAGNGDGSFQTVLLTPLAGTLAATMYTPYLMKHADMNGDGIADIVVASRYNLVLTNITG